jgi:hypothetical protein
MIMPLPVRWRAAVARLSPMKVQLVDHPRVLTAAAAFLGSDSLNDGVQVRALRHHLGGDDAAGQDQIGLGREPLALELIVVPVRLFEHAPGLVVRDLFHPLHQVVGNAWTPVR